MKQRLALALLAVGAAALCAGSAASSQPSAGAIPLLRVGAILGQGTVDPAQTQGGPALVYEDLLQFAPDGSLQPMLATSVTRPGPDVYIYHLRHGVKFWDGNEMTSADVTNSLNYLRYPKVETSTFFNSVKTIVATDRYTVVVTLKHRDASWQFVPAFDGQVWEKSYQLAHKQTWGQPGTLVMSTGPWKLDKLDPTTGMEFSANPHWWGGKVNIQHITEKFFADETSEALAMRAGEVDVAFPSLPQPFAATSKAKIVTIPSTTVGYLALNTRVAPFNDVHVRRAIAYAIDKPDIVRAVGGYATPVDTVIVPQVLRTIASKAQVDALLKSLPHYPFNLAKARAELAKSRYPDGFSTSTDIIDFGGLVNANQALGAEVAKIGIHLKVNVIDIGSWLNEIYGENGRTYGWDLDELGGLSPDPGYFVGFELGSKNVVAGGSNEANYVNPTLDTLLKEGITAVTHKQRFAVYSKVLQLVGTELPYIPLFVTDATLALANGFSWPSFSIYGGRDWPLQLKKS
jgi:peptide/nickel transport system substrate-binding protein